MAWVTTTWDSGVTLKPHQTDLNCFKVVKTRSALECCNCKKKIPAKTFCYGSDWVRLCLECGDKFSYKAIDGFQGIIDNIKLNQDRLKENGDKWRAENSLALL